MNTINIATTIEDSLGLKTGIGIKKIRVVYDRCSDWIRISGHLVSNSRIYTSFEYEPDLQVDLINRLDQVCMSGTSIHSGCFAASQKVSFSLEMKNISEFVPWEEVQKIHMYIIFRERK